MKRTRNLLTVGVVVLLGALLVAGLAGCGGAPKVDWELKVSGAVDNPLALSYSDLTKMPQVDLKDILMEKSLGEDEVCSWSGAAVDQVLKQAGASANYSSVTALAADG